MSISKEEINSIAIEFLELKKLAETQKDSKSIKKYKNYQNFCMESLAHLVNNKTNRYKKFSNYNDLCQDGFEALLLSFKTFQPEKGDFCWWASKYIGTRVSRAANNHATIKIPMKKSREIHPYKTNSIPILLDNRNQELEIEKLELKKILSEALSELPEINRQAINLYYSADNQSDLLLSKISKRLNLPKISCMKLINDTEIKLKKTMENRI